MATVVVFHPVLGIRQGVLDARDRLTADGHEVVVPDLFEGRTFDDYDPAMHFAWQELGQAELMRRAAASVGDVPDGFIPIGFSLGCIFVAQLAVQRKVSAVAMLAGAIPVDAGCRLAGGTCCANPRNTR